VKQIIEKIEQEQNIKIDCDYPAIKHLIECFDNGYLLPEEFKQWILIELRIDLNYRINYGN